MQTVKPLTNTHRDITLLNVTKLKSTWEEHEERRANRDGLPFKKIYRDKKLISAVA